MFKRFSYPVGVEKAEEVTKSYCVVEKDLAPPFDLEQNGFDTGKIGLVLTVDIAVELIALPLDLF